MAVIVGGFLLAMSISFFKRLPKKYLIEANNEGVYIYSGFFSLGFIPFTKIEDMVWHKERFTRHSRSLEIRLEDNHRLNFGLFYRIQMKLLRYRYNDCLIISLSLCKGKAEDIAKVIIDAWAQFKDNTKPKEE